MDGQDPFASIDIDYMMGFVSSIFSELNIGLLIYHLEDLNQPRTLRLIYANTEASEYTGADLSELTGLSICEAFPGLTDTDVPEVYAGVVTSKRPQNLGTFEYKGDDKVESGFFAVKAFPMPKDCVGVVFENITLRKQLEAMVKKERERDRKS